MKVGYQIKALRESRHRSRDQLAELLDISPNTLYKMEKGDRTPTLDDLKIISDVFKVDPAMFFNCDGGTFINNGDYSPGAGVNNIVG